MYKGKRFLALIPARSGSKGLPDKNIRLLNGKPMIAYTIEAAKESNIFDHILVSTDSVKYADIATNYGAWVPFLRPKHLATDYASSFEVIKYNLIELEKKGYKFDYFMLLQPTSPLRNEQDINNAVNLLFEKKAKSIVSVCESEHSPLLMNTLDESLSMENFINSEYNKRRQELTTYFRLNGAIYLSEIDYSFKYLNFYGKKSFAYKMSKKNSIDVDSMIDFQLADILLREYMNTQNNVQ